MVVVVPGHRLRSRTPHQQLRGRVDVGVDLFRATGDEFILFTGGRSNPDVDAIESGVMARYAKQQGVSGDRILTDGWALDTIGNGVASRIIIDESDASGPVRVVTSCFHRERSKYVFEQCFSPRYRVTAPECYDATEAVPDERRSSENEKLAFARDFFEHIDTGDIGAICEHVEERHPDYDSVPGAVYKKFDIV